MIHIFQNPKTKKFDFVFFSRERIADSMPQGYDRISGCIKSICSVAKKCFGMKPEDVIKVQDDSKPASVVYLVPVGKGKITISNEKPKPKYIPKWKKR